MGKASATNVKRAVGLKNGKVGKRTKTCDRARKIGLKLKNDANGTLLAPFTHDRIIRKIAPNLPLAEALRTGRHGKARTMRIQQQAMRRLSKYAEDILSEIIRRGRDLRDYKGRKTYKIQDAKMAVKTMFGSTTPWP